MIEKLIFGTVKLKIDGFDTSLLCGKLQQICKVVSLYTSSDTVFLTTIGIHEKRVRELCESSHCVCETLERRGIAFKVTKYIKRFGIYAGTLAMAALIFYLSNIVMKIQINGTSDEATIAEIRGILKAEGVSAGTYIPSINFLELGNKLFSGTDKVAWASVGSNGSILIVNVSEPTSCTDDRSARIPCNIVASRDAVVVDAKVMVGELSVLLGDAVYQGQMLVSGIVDRDNGIAKYYHSYARIIGRYEQEVNFEQNYIEESLTDGEKIYRKSLKFFELELPLPGHLLDKDKNYAVRSHNTPVKLFGLTLPFSVTSYEYTEKIEDIRTFSTAEAYSELYKRLESYEKNILAEERVIERTITEEMSDSGVRLNVKYVLEGDIGREAEIYIK